MTKHKRVQLTEQTNALLYRCCRRYTESLAVGAECHRAAAVASRWSLGVCSVVAQQAASFCWSPSSFLHTCTQSYGDKNGGTTRAWFRSNLSRMARGKGLCKAGSRERTQMNISTTVLLKDKATKACPLLALSRTESRKQQLELSKQLSKLNQPSFINHHKWTAASPRHG